MKSNIKTFVAFLTISLAVFGAGTPKLPMVAAVTVAVAARRRWWHMGGGHMGGGFGRRRHGWVRRRSHGRFRWRLRHGRVRRCARMGGFMGAVATAPNGALRRRGHGDGAAASAWVRDPE